MCFLLPYQQGFSWIPIFPFLGSLQGCYAVFQLGGKNPKVPNKRIGNLEKTSKTDKAP